MNSPLESLKTCFVFTTLALAQKWVRLCESWLEERKERAMVRDDPFYYVDKIVVERAEEITKDSGYVHFK